MTVIGEVLTALKTRIKFLVLFWTLSILLWKKSPKLNLFLLGGATKGHEVEQLVEALDYKPEGRGLDSRWRHWNFSLI